MDHRRRMLALLTPGILLLLCASTRASDPSAGCGDFAVDPIRSTLLASGGFSYDGLISANSVFEVTGGVSSRNTLGIVWHPGSIGEPPAPGPSSSAGNIAAMEFTSEPSAHALVIPLPAALWTGLTGFGLSLALSRRWSVRSIQ